MDSAVNILNFRLRLYPHLQNCSFYLNGLTRTNVANSFQNCRVPPLLFCSLEVLSNLNYSITTENVRSLAFSLAFKSQEEFDLCVKSLSEKRG